MPTTTNVIRGMDHIGVRLSIAPGTTQSECARQRPVRVHYPLLEAPLGASSRLDAADGCVSVCPSGLITFN
jgi:hypothetical protein